jgi:hypothetical protein
MLAQRHPAGQLHRITSGTSKFTIVSAPFLRLIRGRADAPPPVRRMLLSGACAVALSLAAARMNLSGGLIWSAMPIIVAAGLLALDGLSLAPLGVVDNS